MHIKVCALVFIVSLALSPALSQEIRLHKDTCLLLQSVCTDSKVNLRSSPSLSSKIIGKLEKNQIVYISAISEEIETIDSFTGPWLRVRIVDGTKKIIEGWAFSRFIDVKRDIRVSSFEFVSYEERRPKKTNVLRLKITGGNYPRVVEVYPIKMPGKEYFAFIWNEDNLHFIYSDPAGSFIWYPNTNTIKHVTYLGQSDESAWVQFTDDFQYMIEDFGTWPGPRGLVVYELKTNTEVFSGTYYKDININGYTITIVVTQNSAHRSDGTTDDEALARINKFISTNPMPSSDGTLAHMPIAIYSLNIKTMERAFIKCEYIETQ